MNILHQLAISNFHPHGPVCLFLPSCDCDEYNQNFLVILQIASINHKQCSQLFFQSPYTLRVIPRQSSIRYCPSVPVRYLHVGGLWSALATSDILAITVFIPLPLPSTCNETVQHTSVIPWRKPELHN